MTAVANRPAKVASGKQGAAHRRKVFAAAYLSNGENKTKAAIEAGFSERSAHTQGCMLFKHPEVQALIAQHQSKVISELDITVERILKERARLAFFNARKLFDDKGRIKRVDELDEDTAAAIAGLEVDENGYLKKLRLADKNASLTALEKFKGLQAPESDKAPSETRGPTDLIEAARIVAFALAAGTQALELANKVKKQPSSESSGLVIDQG